LSSGKRNTNALPQVAWAEPPTHESGRIVGKPEVMMRSGLLEQLPGSP
jgi:hypothetical protein